MDVCQWVLAKSLATKKLNKTSSFFVELEAWCCCYCYCTQWLASLLQKWLNFSKKPTFLLNKQENVICWTKKFLTATLKHECIKWKILACKNRFIPSLFKVLNNEVLPRQEQVCYQKHHCSIFATNIIEITRTWH